MTQCILLYCEAQVVNRLLCAGSDEEIDIAGSEASQASLASSLTQDIADTASHQRPLQSPSSQPLTELQTLAEPAATGIDPEAMEVSQPSIAMERTQGEALESAHGANGVFEAPADHATAIGAHEPR